MSWLQLVAEVGETIEQVAERAQTLIQRVGVDAIEVVHNNRVVRSGGDNGPRTGEAIVRAFDRIQQETPDPSKRGTWVVESINDVEAIFPTEIEALRYAVQEKLDARFAPYGNVNS